jgi:hypothetical protein
MIESKIETKHIIAELSVTEKICLYNALYEDLAGKGTEGDTELAHVNKAEMAVLRDMGGSGTVNPNTGLIQFGGGSPPPPPPSNTSVSQTSEFPAELKPFIQDVLGKSQAIQEKRESEGYIPFEGPQIAEFSPEQEQAFTGIQGLVGQGQEYFDPSADLAKSSTGAYTPEAVRAAMSPFTQNVVDIQQREALRQADVAQQQLAAQAASAGGLGGSRMAILEAEQNRNTQQLLGDIQARGQAAAFEDAQTRLAQQSGRELAASGQLMNLGSVAPQQALKEYTAVEAIGAQKQAQTQQALNIAKSQFQEEQTFPEQTLQQYQSVIRGFPLAPSTYTNTQTVNPAPSYLQQAAGLGATGLGLASAFGGFGKGAAQGGLVSRMQGGPVDQNRGLGSIVVKRQQGRSVSRPQDNIYDGRPMSSLKLRPEDGFSIDSDINPRPPPKDILRESDEERFKRILGVQPPKSFEERNPQFNDGKGSRATRALTYGQQAWGDFVGDTGTQMGRDITSLGEYLFGDIGKTPLSLAQIRVVQEAEGNRPDLAGSIRASAKKIIENSKKENIDLSPNLLAKSLALDLRPISEVGGEVAARDANMFTQERAVGSSDSLRDLARIAEGNAARDNMDDDTLLIDGKGSLSTLAKQVNPPAPTPAATAPAATAPAATAPAATATTTPLDDLITEQGVDDSPYPEGYDAKFADKLDKATTASQYSTSRLPDVMRETREELFKAQQKRATEKGAELEKRRTGLDNDRWLALANLGTSILAQPGGQTFLQALGKGAKDSNIISTLSKLNREDADLASKIKDIPVELLVSKFKLKKDEAQYVKDSTNFELKIAELEAAKIAATSKAQKDQFDKMIKALNLNIRARTLDFTLKGGKSSLTKQDNEYLDDFIKTKRKEMGELSPNTTGWWNVWDADKGQQNRENMKQAFKDYARRNKPTDINTNWDNFAKRYK